jgi:hypothetical protein
MGAWGERTDVQRSAGLAGLAPCEPGDAVACDRPVLAGEPLRHYGAWIDNKFTVKAEIYLQLPAKPPELAIASSPASGTGSFLFQPRAEICLKRLRA